MVRAATFDYGAAMNRFLLLLLPAALAVACMGEPKVAPTTPPAEATKSATPPKVDAAARQLTLTYFTMTG
jgi:hypothetical protein